MLLLEFHRTPLHLFWDRIHPSTSTVIHPATTSNRKLISSFYPPPSPGEIYLFNCHACGNYYYYYYYSNGSQPAKERCRQRRWSSTGRRTTDRPCCGSFSVDGFLFFVIHPLQSTLPGLCVCSCTLKKGVPPTQDHQAEMLIYVALSPLDAPLKVHVHPSRQGRPPSSAEE